MYRNSYQRGMLTVFFSCGSNPLKLWDQHIKDGYIESLLDQDIKSMVLEVGGTNVSTTYIECPKGKQVLGIVMPFLIMIVKNLKKYFNFEVTILDDTGTRRRFRASNFQSKTQILPLCTAMPMGLSDGWNRIQFNLAEFTRRAYNKQFVEVQKVKINANIRLRRVYFAERLVPEEELPPEYKLYFPLISKGAKKISSEKMRRDSEEKQIEVKKSFDRRSIKSASSVNKMHKKVSKASTVKMSQEKLADQHPAAEHESINSIPKIEEESTVGEGEERGEENVNDESVPDNAGLTEQEGIADTEHTAEEEAVPEEEITAENETAPEQEKETAPEQEKEIAPEQEKEVLEEEEPLPEMEQSEEVSPESANQAPKVPSDHKAGKVPSDDKVDVILETASMRKRSSGTLKKFSKASFRGESAEPA